MANQLEIVEAQALQLKPEERARLADRLIASLTGGEEIDEAWAVEVERRVQEIESGRARLIPAAEAISRVRAAIDPPPMIPSVSAEANRELTDAAAKVSDAAAEVCGADGSKSFIPLLTANGGTDRLRSCVGPGSSPFLPARASFA